MIMNTKCNFCGNKNFKETKVQYIYKQKDNFLIVNDVPCVQCVYCGEQYFEGKVLSQIEEEFNQIYIQGKVPERELKVPIEHFHEFNRI
jgi:YgiT-type zinc finger domain-containing protein